jgi:ribose transport system substrate-binding protein
VAVLAAVGVSVACGSPGARAHVAGASAAATGVAGAQAEVAKWSTLPKFVAPGANLNAKKIAKGKTLFIESYSSAIPYNAAFDAAVTQYAQMVGFKVIHYPTSGLADGWTRGIDLAISDHVNAIDLDAGLDVRAVEPAIKKAEAAGIVVLDSTFADNQTATPSYMSGGVPLNYFEAGRLEAAYAIWKTHGKADVLSLNTPGIEPSVGVGGGQAAAFKAYCPACKQKTLSITIPNWATQIPTQVTAAINADPSVNYILPYYDSQTALVQPSLNTLGKHIPQASFNGTPSILQLVKNGTVAMDVDEDVAWAGAASVDSVLRVLGHVPPDSGTINEHIPLRVIDKSNIAALGSTIGFNSGFGTAQNGYLKVWELQK